MKMIRGDRRQNQSDRRATCALLFPEGPADTVDVAELQTALVRRGVELMHLRGVYDAMAQAVMREQTSLQSDRREPFIVVLVEPSRIPMASRLYEALVRHAPQTALWEHRKAPESRLTAYVPPARSSPSPEGGMDPAGSDPIAPPSPRPAVHEAFNSPGNYAKAAAPAARSLRLAGIGPEPYDTLSGPSDEPGTMRPAASAGSSEERSSRRIELSPEELEMLLADPSRRKRSKDNG